MPHSKGFAHRRDRRREDPVAIGEVIDALMADEAFAKARPIAELASRWADIVGPRVAAETAPASLDEGVLTVRASNGPWGAQARFLTEQIREQANRSLGGEPIRAVRVVVGPQRPATG
jgi:predicted nucleic acid-binding Zn ribbon protein